MIYHTVIYIFSFFNSKAALWISGRKNWKSTLRDKLKKCNNSGPLLWFHCASLGEFEQARPLIEAYRHEFPDDKILLSFFSPSGYEIQKNYKGADVVFYLPLDSKSNAKEWLSIIKPSAVFFIKYEFWYHYIKEISNQKIPLFLVSGIFRKNQAFFKSWGLLHREMLSSFTHLFIQEEQSKILLNSIGIENISVCGDTRIDRVLALKEPVITIPEIEKFTADNKILVCGSTWPEDEKILLELWNHKLSHQDWKLIIAPHEIGKNHLQNLYNSFDKNSKPFFYSKIRDIDFSQSKVLIIDNIGLLKKLYRYADLAYVGGGFGKGIHNILEAAVFQIPVCFGPNHKKFKEAGDLIQKKVAFEIKKTSDFIDIIESPGYKETAKKAEIYFNTQKGATATILNFSKSILKNL